MGTACLLSPGDLPGVWDNSPTIGVSVSWPALCFCHICLLGCLLGERVIVTQSDAQAHTITLFTPNPITAPYHSQEQSSILLWVSQKEGPPNPCKIMPALGCNNLMLYHLLSHDLNHQDWPEFPFRKIGLSRRKTKEQVLSPPIPLLFFLRYFPLMTCCILWEAENPQNNSD